MEISKTAFKEYARCLRVLPLERLYLQRLGAESFFNDEQKEKMRELLTQMFSAEDGEDLLREENAEQEAMLDYYEEVERWALVCAEKQFGRAFAYHRETKKQKCFRFTDPYGNAYYCHLDGYSEGKNECIVIEVKATTSRKFRDLGPKISGKLVPLFRKENNIYRLGAIEPQYIEKTDRHFRKLFDPYSDVGRYVFDLAVERYIVENSILQNHPHLRGKKFQYYLAVLNSDYVFSEEYEGEIPKYITSGDDSLVSFIDLTAVSKEFLPLIDKIRENISRSIQHPRLETPKIGSYCEFGKRHSCLFTKICFPELHEEGALTEYMNFRGLKSEGKNLSNFDLINAFKRKMTDVPVSALNANQRIQRNCFEKKSEYFDARKIDAGIKTLKYPVYHLDFESFPCPLPRFRGEKPFSQSLFQYSVHVEREPGICDEIADNYGFLARDFSDCREELVRSLLETIDLGAGGTVVVYNKTFEENRLKELADLFPEHRPKLERIQASLFDLQHLLKSNKKFYQKLGFSEEESGIINYYHRGLRGLYSIKRVLPLFSDLKYEDLKVKNGTEAIALYAGFKRLPPEDIEVLREDLIKYCRQDTWSLFLILDALRKRIQ
ncbi:MAG: DUF2779 domain-containing protein [Acholeplasmataceae bacterium]|nr:DUF2779 domain-containing protein [Acholeplasmataceae bacterium]